MSCRVSCPKLAEFCTIVPVCVILEIFNILVSAAEKLECWLAWHDLFYRIFVYIYIKTDNKVLWKLNVCTYMLLGLNELLYYVYFI